MVNDSADVTSSGRAFHVCKLCMRAGDRKSWATNSRQSVIVDVSICMCVCCTEAGTYRYLGCYKDVSGIRRDLKGRDMMMSGLTTHVCAGQCQPVGYPYFGLQLGSRCFCGDNYGNHGASIG